MAIIYHLDPVAFIEFADGSEYPLTQFEISSTVARDDFGHQTVYKLKVSTLSPCEETKKTKGRCRKGKCRAQIKQLQDEVVELRRQVQELRAASKLEAELDAAINRVKFNAEGGFSFN